MIVGISLMITGMLTVFVFLEIMILLVRGMSFIIKKYSLGEEEPKLTKTSENNEDIALVIAVMFDFIQSGENYNG